MKLFINQFKQREVAKRTAVRIPCLWNGRKIVEK